MNARAGMVFGAAEVNCTVQPIPPWSLGAPFRRARSTASTPPRCTARAFHALLVATACDISSTHRLPPRHSTALVRARRILLGSRSACMGRAVCGGCCVSDSGAHALSWNGASSFACAGRRAVGGVSPLLGVALYRGARCASFRSAGPCASLRSQMATPAHVCGYISWARLRTAPLGD